MSIVCKNLTPFPHLQFSNTDNRGYEFGVLMIKVAFDVGADGACTPAPEQEPFNFSDRTYGDMFTTSLRYPSDLVSYKPGTDIIADVIAHAPDAKPSARWDAGIQVVDGDETTIEKRICVRGPRFWQPKWRLRLTDEQTREWRKHRKLFRGWELTEAEPIEHLPVHYEFAYGGSIAKEVDENGKPVLDAYEQNPIGRGLIDRDWTDHTKPVAAPQLEPLDATLNDAYAPVAVAGLGPIPPDWQPRLRRAGTYDDNWKKHIWPKWPPDYDFAYNNSAAEGLTSKRHLRGVLRIVLLNLRREASKFILSVPDVMPWVVKDMADGEPRFVCPHLDTIFLSMAPDDLFDCRVTLTFRTSFHWTDTKQAIIRLPNEAERKELAQRSELINPAPHPFDCGVPCKDLERS